MHTNCNDHFIVVSPQVSFLDLSSRMNMGTSPGAIKWQLYMLSVPQHVTVWTPKIQFLIGHTEIWTLYRPCYLEHIHWHYHMTMLHLCWCSTMISNRGDSRWSLRTIVSVQDDKQHQILVGLHKADKNFPLAKSTLCYSYRIIQNETTLHQYPCYPLLSCK